MTMYHPDKKPDCSEAGEITKLINHARDILVGNTADHGFFDFSGFSDPFPRTSYDRNKNKPKQESEKEKFDEQLASQYEINQFCMFNFEYIEYIYKYYKNYDRIVDKLALRCESSLKLYLNQLNTENGMNCFCTIYDVQLDCSGKMKTIRFILSEYIKSDGAQLTSLEGIILHETPLGLKYIWDNIKGCNIDLRKEIFTMLKVYGGIHLETTCPNFSSFVPDYYLKNGSCRCRLMSSNITLHPHITMVDLFFDISCSVYENDESIKKIKQLANCENITDQLITEVSITDFDDEKYSYCALPVAFMFIRLLEERKDKGYTSSAVIEAANILNAKLEKVLRPMNFFASYYIDIIFELKSRTEFMTSSSPSNPSQGHKYNPS